MAYQTEKKRQLEEQAANERRHRANLEEKERQREAEKKRQLEEKAANERHEFAMKQGLFSLSLFAIPICVGALSYKLNFAAVSFYVLFSLVAIALMGGLILLIVKPDELYQNPEEKNSEDHARLIRGINICAGCLTAGFAGWSTISFFSDDLIGRTILWALMTLVLPFTPYVRGAVGLVSAGIIVAFGIHFVARFCSFVIMSFLSFF